MGPILFTLYTSDLPYISTQEGVNSHFYADDSQLYITSDENGVSHANTRLPACCSRFNDWLASNRLLMNADKTEFIYLPPPRLGTLNPPPSLVVANTSIQPSAKARNLGFIFDGELSLQDQISSVVSSCFYELRRIRCCSSSVPQAARIKLVVSLVLSRLDFCNSLYYGLPRYSLDRLQAVLNAAARTALGLKKFDHISIAMRDVLHWLPIHQRIHYKVCLITFKALLGLAPSYLSELLTPTTAVSSRARLRSAASGMLVEP